MEIALIVISIILIVLVLLQSSKAQDGGQIISGGNSELFMNVKERGSELFLSWFSILCYIFNIILKIGFISYFFVLMAIFYDKIMLKGDTYERKST